MPPKDEIRELIKSMLIEEYERTWGKQKKDYIDYLADLYSDFEKDFSGNIERLSAMFGDIRGKRVLDFGCGWGNFIIYGFLKGYNIFGLDISRTRQKFFREVAEKFSLPESVKSRYIIYDGENIPFKKSSFDIVIANQVLEHVKDIERCLREIYRITKSGGIFYVRSPDYSRSFFEPHYRVPWAPFVKGKIAKIYVSFLGKPKDGLENINHIGKRKLIRIARGVGFSVLKDVETEIITNDRKRKVENALPFRIPDKLLDFLNSIYEVFRQMKMIGREENQIDIVFQKV